MVKLLHTTELHMKVTHTYNIILVFSGMAVVSNICITNKPKLFIYNPSQILL